MTMHVYDEHWDVLIDGKKHHLKVLRDPKDHAEGYQYQSFPPSPGEGLLFIFLDERPRAFHMRNVEFDLDLLGFNESGKLVCNIPMKANGKKVYSTPPCKFIVEIAKSWGSDIHSLSEECRLKLVRDRE